MLFKLETVKHTRNEDDDLVLWIPILMNVWFLVNLTWILQGYEDRQKSRICNVKMTTVKKYFSNCIKCFIICWCSVSIVDFRCFRGCSCSRVDSHRSGGGHSVEPSRTPRSTTATKHHQDWPPLLSGTSSRHLHYPCHHHAVCSFQRTGDGSAIFVVILRRVRRILLKFDMQNVLEEKLRWVGLSRWVGFRASDLLWVMSAACSIPFMMCNYSISGFILLYVAC